MTEPVVRALRAILILAAVVLGCGCVSPALSQPVPGAAGTTATTGAAGAIGATTGAAGATVGATTGAAGAIGATTGAAGAIDTTTGAAGATGAVPTPTTLAPVIPSDDDVLTVAPADLIVQLGHLLWNPDEDIDATTLGVLTSTLPTRALTRRDARALAELMLADGRARPRVEAFYRWWLNLDEALTMQKAPEIFPELDDVLRARLASEPAMFGAAVTLDEVGTFERLLSADFTFMDSRLAALYGAADAPGPEMIRVWTAGLDRPGLLSLAGYIAPRGGYDRRWPSQMGMHVLQDFLCYQIPPEPPTTAPFPTGDPMRSMRALSADVSANSSCGACHQPLDGIGFGFLGFDALGRAQTVDGSDPVDDRGAVGLVFDPARSFRGVGELGELLAKSEPAQRCHVAKWLAFLTRSAVNSSQVRPDDVAAVSLEQAYAAFAASGFELRALIAAAATSPSFYP